jgi:RNA polymerase sigma factor for flagellar operon FliA
VNNAHATEHATHQPIQPVSILAHQDLVRSIAYSIHRRLPASVELDDLISTGMVGLLTAQQRYDAERGVPFAAFARFYVQGAIMDSLRDADWVPRAVRRKAQRLEREVDGFYRSKGRKPTEAEVAETLDLSADELTSMQRDARIIRLTSFDQPLGEDGSATVGDRVAADTDDAESTLIDVEMRQTLLKAVEGLPERERVAVSLYYFRGLQLKEIGAILGVSESRVCQLRGQGTARLRKRLANLR